MKKVIDRFSQNAFIDRYLVLVILFLLFTGVFLLMKTGFEWSFYFLILLIGFGYNQIIFFQKLTFFHSLMLSWFTGSVILIVYVGLTNFPGIPINGVTILIFFIISVVIFILNINHYRLTSISFKIDKFDCFAALVALLAIGAKVVSIKDFYAPIVHDPMSHAEWAKSIVETGFISYFYSPGLHILAAAGEITGGFNVARQTLFITNIFNALIGIPIYILLKEGIKKDWWAVSAIILFSLGTYPTNLYFTAGKNSFIMSVSLVILIFYILICTKKHNWKTILFTNALVYALIITHYPNGFIAAILIGSYYLFNFRLIKQALLLIPGFFLGASWGFIKYSLFFAKIVNPIYANYRNLTPQWSIRYIKDTIISTWNGCTICLGTSTLSIVILILSLIGLMSLVFYMNRKKENRWMVFGLAIFISTMLIIGLFKIDSIKIIYITQMLFSFTFFYLSAAFAISHFIIPFFEKRWRYTYIPIILLMTIISVISARNIYKKYQSEQLASNMVTKYDMDVFEWIESNIDKNEIILNNGIMGFEGIVFPTDSGAWIPAFTFNKIAIPFSEFSTLNTYENHILHQAIIKDPGNCDILDQFIKKGITYYYRGRNEIYGPSLRIDEEYLAINLYELLYKSNEAKIYKINGCSD
jgi:hypothetical protein